jgi:hypothetical protein
VPVQEFAFLAVPRTEDPTFGVYFLFSSDSYRSGLLDSLILESGFDPLGFRAVQGSCLNFVLQVRSEFTPMLGDKPPFVCIVSHKL